MESNQVEVENMSQKKKPRLSMKEVIASILSTPIQRTENSQDISDESVQIRSNFESSESGEFVQVD